jgi:hypothetical protein
MEAAWLHAAAKSVGNSEHRRRVRLISRYLPLGNWNAKTRNASSPGPFLVECSPQGNTFLLRREQDFHFSGQAMPIFFLEKTENIGFNSPSD